MIYRLPKQFIFPPLHEADEDGLLAVGGDLQAGRILAAYQAGIFPWYSEEPILWWSPDPRFVLFPDELKVSASMKQVLKKKVFHITFNQAFTDVIRGCSGTPRPGQDGTWLNPDMQQAYTELHTLGVAHSVECWLGATLVGGLYGLLLGHTFFGESMFSTVSNASKAAFITFVHTYAAQGMQLVDCQVYTPHLESFGARFIPRDEFVRRIQEH
ncbi:leucyl/phenylalanyl-tRNA--protein transferase [Chitinophaga costaii]|uniref:Leucyl/phenylalanyl-tRNA--protein transferase n=1 Tax=Chitinophaga costaii TaxID=1335309 RepID=A0A1C4DAM3_9BACT|nr:leucyl/phenylalanyl-tRNA--protein transferase [Chitinophaga costaii]PUZ24533.1 leucyl/phenylalanyl-tRNA--protein transferase [Chitinophaga costaii]SCC28336.1 leucyl/phenylalanyl-tRNA--protein transferase [Chitinophaga costaii]